MRDENEKVVLVDSDDREIGTGDKLAIHREGQRHRAVSVFLRDRAGRMLMQRRALSKYHSPGLWANACCSHPRPAETARAAAERRLQEELGLVVTLRDAGRIGYRAELPKRMIENEIVHLFVGETDEVPRPDPGEVAEWKWIAPDELAQALDGSPEQFTAWFRIYASRIPEIALKGSSG